MRLGRTYAEDGDVFELHGGSLVVIWWWWIEQAMGGVEYESRLSRSGCVWDARLIWFSLCVGNVYFISVLYRGLHLMFLVERLGLSDAWLVPSGALGCLTAKLLAHDATTTSKQSDKSCINLSKV